MLDSCYTCIDHQTHQYSATVRRYLLVALDLAFVVRPGVVDGGNLDDVSNSRVASLHSDSYIDASSVNSHTWITYDATSSRDDTSMIVP
jgi:hypothetical protein